MARLLAILLFAAGTALAQDDVRPVKLATAAESSGALARQFFGEVVARRTVDLAFQVSGQILQMPVIEGEITAEGALIGQLDLETFQLSLDQANVQLDQARRTYDRLQRLSGSTVSEVTVQDAETQVALAEIAVRNAEHALKHASLSAPFDALIATRLVDNFTTISAGTPVVRIHDMSELRIEIDVPEILFQRAGEDPDVEVTAQFPFSDRVFPLEVREFNAETSNIGQTFSITFGMPPPEGLVVLPGASVTVTAVLKDAVDPGLSVPPSALLTSPDGSVRVMVFEPAGAEEGTVSARPVTIVADANGRLRVTEGLAAGEDYVVAGAGSLSDGQAVRRFTGFRN